MKYSANIAIDINNRHLNSADNIARKTIIKLCYFIDVLSSRTAFWWVRHGQNFLFIGKSSIQRCKGERLNLNELRMKKPLWAWRMKLKVVQQFLLLLAGLPPDGRDRKSVFQSKLGIQTTSRKRGQTMVGSDVPMLFLHSGK